MRTPNIKRFSSAILPWLKVKRSEPTMVVPAVTTPRELKTLSDLDNSKALMTQNPVLMLYKHNSAMAGKDPAKVIREALAKVLVPYYPFAGRLVEGSRRDDDTSGLFLLVDCKGEGIPFIEADADNKLDQVIDRIESGERPFFQELLHDDPAASGILGCPLWLFQVTRFRCGGFTLALRFNHIVTEGSGVAQFLNAMAEYARGAKTPSLAPVWQRDNFIARKPRRITCQHVELEEADNISPEATIECKINNLITKSFHFGSEEIRSLKKHIQNQTGETCTTFEVLTACLWRSRTRALKLDPNQVVQLICVSNGRYHKDLEVPRGYYGNMVAYPAVNSTSESLCTRPFTYAVELVRKAKAKMSGEYLKSFLDTMERSGPVNPWPFAVADSRNLGIGEADFGWGKPVFAGPVAEVTWSCTYSYFKEGIIVQLSLPHTVMGRFQNELKLLLESLHNPMDQFEE